MGSLHSEFSMIPRIDDKLENTLLYRAEIIIKQPHLLNYQHRSDYGEPNTQTNDSRYRLYFAPADENFVTDFVPSDIACLANSPGRISRTDVWISREEIVDFLE